MAADSEIVGVGSRGAGVGSSGAVIGNRGVRRAAAVGSDGAEPIDSFEMSSWAVDS